VKLSAVSRYLWKTLLHALGSCRAIQSPSCKTSAKFASAWTRYGFVNAFNPLTAWYDQDAVGIASGITELMVENGRNSCGIPS
jgi:hypothetical protein